MKTQHFVLPLMAAIAFAGCSSAQRTVTVGFGPPTVTGAKEVVKMTQKTSFSTFLTSIQGFSDSVGADGTSTTTVNNYSSDNQAISLLIGGLENMAAMFLMANNTNANPVIMSNLFSTLKKSHR